MSALTELQGVLLVEGSEKIKRLQAERDALLKAVEASEQERDWSRSFRAVPNAARIGNAPPASVPTTFASLLLRWSGTAARRRSTRSQAMSDLLSAMRRAVEAERVIAVELKSAHDWTVGIVAAALVLGVVMVSSAIVGG